MAPVVVVRRLLHHKAVTRQTLFGALSGYLLIAIALSFALQTVGSVQSTPFFGSPQPTTTFIYYSLVTVTTVGYGDFTAATDLGRMLSVFGAVLGQVYLVVVVAMVVGLLAQRRRQT
nr:potassium channel family protein [Salsipaludibacter albus]